MPRQDDTAGSIAPEGRKVPRHVAIMMDGNGRWAQNRGLPRSLGHRKGAEALRLAVRDAGELGIEVLTVFAFSSENWLRPQEEVSELMELVRRFVRNDLATLHARNVRLRILGDRAGLDPDIARLLAEAQELTAGNSGTTLAVAFNYGGKQEILRAARAIAADAAAGRLAPEAIDAPLFERHLDTAGMPDPDLVIRTSGEVRLSNFLLWQAAYAEFVSLPVLWPDFDRRWFELALAEYAKRERRFGAAPASNVG